MWLIFAALSAFFLTNAQSGLATGASWLCYFKALRLGKVSKVVPIDRMSFILTILMVLK